MIQIQEKRLNPLRTGQLRARIEDLSLGLINAAIINYSKKGSYIETNCPLQLGEAFYIGIKSSPHHSSAGEYKCYRAKIIRKQKALYTTHKYGYEIKFVFVHDDQSIKYQRFTALKNVRKYLRKPYHGDILFLFNNQIVEGTIKNISPKGAFIETQQAFSGGEIVKFYKLKKRNFNGKLMGKVVWHDAQGIGIHFLKSKDHD